MMNNNRALIAALKHSQLRNGEVVIKLNDELITGRLTEITMNMQEACYTSFEIKGIVDK